MISGLTVDLMRDLGILLHKGNSPILVHAVLCSIQATFSGWHIIGSLSLKEGANPLIFGLYRELLASLLMYIFVRMRNERIMIEEKDRMRFLFLGFCSFLNVVGTVLALQYISPTKYSMMQPTIAVIASIISFTIGIENISGYQALGIILAVSGAITVECWTGDTDESDLGRTLLGGMLVTAQVTGMASLIVFQKPLLSRYPPAVLTVVYYSIGSIITLIACVLWSYSFQPPDFYFDGKVFPWLGLAYVSIFSTAYAYNAYSWAGKQVPPTITTIYNTLQPVFTSALSFVFFKIVPTYVEVLGGLLVVAGLFATVRGKSKEIQILMNSTVDKDIP